jgi:hypothetical protein
MFPAQEKKRGHFPRIKHRQTFVYFLHPADLTEFFPGFNGTATGSDLLSGIRGYAFVMILTLLDYLVFSPHWGQKVLFD